MKLFEYDLFTLNNLKNTPKKNFLLRSFSCVDLQVWIPAHMPLYLKIYINFNVKKMILLHSFLPVGCLTEALFSDCEKLLRETKVNGGPVA